MATRQKLKEEFLTCIICHEVFRDPVTLHCGHTFCTQCVTAYTKTQKQAKGEKSIPCPHCRGTTKVPDPTRPVDEWAGQIKTGFFVKGLVETFTGSTQDADICTPCQKDGETTNANVWCSECGHGLCSGCEKYHKRFFTKEHKVIQITSDNRHEVRTRIRFTCPKHTDAVIDMMCEDCDVAICHRCCILHHRKCDSVITLEESLPKLKSVIEAHRKEIDVAVTRNNKELSVKKSQLNDVEKEAEEAVNAIEVAGEKIMAEIRQQQEQLKKKVKQAKEEAFKNLNADIKECQMRLEESKQRHGLIKEAMDSGILMNYYEMYKICKPSPVEVTIPDVEGKIVIHVKIEDNSSEIVSHIREKSFVSLGIFGDGPMPIGPGSMPTLLRKIDTGLTDIWDVLVMTANGIKTVIAMSMTQRKVASFYRKQDENRKSQLDLSGSPYTITKISSDRCALAIHDAKQIKIVCVTPALRRETTITTSKGYFGLTCLSPSTLAAGTGSPGVIEIIDMSGTVLRSFTPQGLNHPVYLACTSDNSILMSDYFSGSVIGITDTGSTMFSYPQSEDNKLTNSRGINLSRSGEIFVAYEGSNTVVQLTETGRFARNVLSNVDGLSKPRALFVDDDNLMYVSVNHTTIHVYEFK